MSFLVRATLLMLGTAVGQDYWKHTSAPMITLYPAPCQFPHQPIEGIRTPSFWSKKDDGTPVVLSVCCDPFGGQIEPKTHEGLVKNIRLFFHQGAFTGNNSHASHCKRGNSFHLKPSSNCFLAPTRLNFLVKSTSWFHAWFHFQWFKKHCF